MILEVDPAAPLAVRLATDALLYLHIGGGGVGLVFGTAALALPKGGRAHRLAGNVFFVSMLIMSGIGAGVAPFLPERASVLGGLVTFYLVATAWITVRRPAGTIGRLEVVGFFVALGLTATALILSVMAANSPTGTLDGQPWQGFVLFNIIAPLAAAGDLKLLLRRGIAGAQRIARHLWRMCTALFIAAASFFIGQPDSLPAFLQESSLRFVPPLVVLLAMTYWLIRVRFARPAGASPGFLRSRAQES